METERQQALSIVSIGCDRTTAARLLGPLAADKGDLARAEAAVEIAHMRCIFNAAQDPKNWRAAVWWLERMRPELYAKREPAAVTDVDIATWTEQIVDAIADEVQDEATRRRVLERIRKIEITTS